MSIRRAAWIVVGLLVLAFGIATARREAQIRAMKGDWDASGLWYRARHEQADNARPELLLRLERIRAELAAGDVPTWAGEYSWEADGLAYTIGGYMPEDCGEICYEFIAVAPKAGAVWWCGLDPNPNFTRFLDWGTIVEADADRIIVNWSIGGAVPHLYEPWSPRVMLTSELVRTRWMGREFLVPQTRMPLFSSPHCSVMSTRAALAPCKGGWTTTEIDERVASQWERTVDAADLPERWRELVTCAPITGDAELIAKPEVLHCWWPGGDSFDAPMPRSWQIWKPLDVGVVYRCEYELPAGTDAGLRVGMPLFTGEFRFPPGVVIACEQGTARVELRFMSDSDTEPASRLRLSTNACFNP